MAKTEEWVLEIVPRAIRLVDPLMGWTSNQDTSCQVKMRFESKADAVDYALSKGLEFQVVQPQARKVNIRQGGYGENFAMTRKSVWTH